MLGIGGGPPIYWVPQTQYAQNPNPICNLAGIADTALCRARHGWVMGYGNVCVLCRIYIEFSGICNKSHWFLYKTHIPMTHNPPMGSLPHAQLHTACDDSPRPQLCAPAARRRCPYGMYLGCGEEKQQSCLAGIQALCGRRCERKKLISNSRERNWLRSWRAALPAQLPATCRLPELEQGR